MPGWVGHVDWLIAGRFTHKVVTRPAASLAQDRESSPATGQDRRSNQMLRHQPPITLKLSRDDIKCRIAT